MYRHMRSEPCKRDRHVQPTHNAATTATLHVQPGPAPAVVVVRERPVEVFEVDDSESEDEPPQAGVIVISDDDSDESAECEEKEVAEPPVVQLPAPQQSQEPCPVCLEIVARMIKLPCEHLLCYVCVSGVVIAWHDEMAKAESRERYLELNPFVAALLT